MSAIGEVESNEHFLCCSHPSRFHLCLQLVVQVQRALDKVRSDPILEDIMLEGIDSFILDHEFPFARYPTKYQSLCRSQDAIGWINLVRGFVSTHWLSLQDEYFRRNGLSDCCGCPDILRVLWCVCHSLFELWRLHNSQRHGKDLQLQESKIRQQTIQHLTELYGFRHSVLPEHRVLFRSSLEVHLFEPQADLLAWLATHSDRICASRETAIKGNVDHTRPLTFYFS